MPGEGRAISKLALLLLAAVALTLMLLPGEVWSEPSSDLEQEGFDTNLLYSAPMSRSAFDPFVVSQHGTWTPCPCPPGSAVTLTGSGLAESRVESERGAFELDGVRLLVDGEPARLRLVAPSQIDFVLPADAAGPVATIELFRDGTSVSSDDVAIGYAPLPDGALVADAEMSLEAGAGSEPEVHVITTPLSFLAYVTATIEAQFAEATPLRMKIWNPRNSSSLELVFGPDRQIRAVFNEGAGRIAREASLSAWEKGVPYDVAFEWVRGERGAISVAGPEGASTFEITPEEAPALFDAYRPTLTVGAAARDGASSVALTDYHLELTPSRFTTLRIDDPIVLPAVALLAALGAALLLASVSPIRIVRWLRGRMANGVGAAWRNAASHPMATLALGSTLACYIAVNFALFSLGSQPFDMGSQTAWAYIAAEYGVSDLYYVSQTTTLADVWNGVPYHEAVFPYNAGMSYYFWLIGETHLLLFGHASPDSTSMQATIKAFNLAFLLADVALIYAIVRHLKPDSSRLPWVVAGVVLFNPAVAFDTTIWGETESVVLLPLLASLLAALKDRPSIAWPLLALAFLSKQTVLLPVLAVAVFYMMRFGLRRSLEGFSAAMVAVLVVILPFTLNGYPPSIAIDPTLAGVWVHGGSGAERAFQLVSYDSFNVWTLVTFAADGASGLARFQTLDYTDFVGPLSYHELGLIALAASLAVVALVVFARWRSLRSAENGIFVAVAIVFALELFLPTQTLSRYYMFCVVFAALGLAGRSRWLSASALVMFTITAFVGQYGSMAQVLQEFPQHGEHLAPQNNALSQVMADCFTSNGFITIAALLNGSAVLGLGGALWRSAIAAHEDAPASDTESSAVQEMIHAGSAASAG